MANKGIEQYLHDTLRPQLAVLGIPDVDIDRVAATVREQMRSCIHHWNDIPFRKALLITGEEEGFFYQPRADVDIRNYVAVTLRNSALESIHADSYSPHGRNRRLAQEDIRAITTAAVEYFMKADIQAMAMEADTIDNDKYGNLAKRYPVTWAALTQLANSTRQIIEYEPLPVIGKQNLNNLTPQKAVSGMFLEKDRAQLMQVTADGYSLTIDHGLFHTLQTVIQNDVPFISDSFKGTSRNMEKLLAVMEYVLCRGLAFITSNYLIANGYIERRLKPVKPGHSHEDIKRNWQNGAGLTQRHKSWLQAAAEI